MTKFLRNFYISLALYGFVGCFFSRDAFAIEIWPPSPPPPAGQYVGYLLPDEQDVRIVAKLFMFAVQQSDQEPELAAIMKLRLGDAASREYISFYYPAVAYNAKAGFFNLDADDQDLTLNHARIEGEGQATRLVGRYHSANGQSDGELILFFCGHRSTCVPPTTEPMIAGRRDLPSLGGTYHGKCPGGKPTDLKIETSKWHHSTNLINNPLPGYRLTARLSHRDASCGASSYCVKNNFSQGTYNFYHGFLRLTGQPTNYNCHMEGNRLICQDHCEFTKTRNLYESLPPAAPARSSGSHSAVRSAEPIENESVSISSNIQDMNEYSGNYTGYLFHDDPHKLQPLKVKIQLYPKVNQDSGADYFDISLSAALFFGQGVTHHQDFITVDFKRRLLPQSHDLVTFDSTSDVVLNIKTWDRHVITGEWISKSYGLVGPFHLERYEGWHPPASLVYISSIPGRYESKLWKFELTTLGDHEIAETESLIFPLPIHGNAQIPGLTSKLPIVRGSYDFYGNSLALELEDGRIVVGETLNERMRLFWPPRPIWGVSDHSQKMSTFVRTDY